MTEQQPSPADDGKNRSGLISAARLFARIFLLELDQSTLAELKEPATQRAVDAVGIWVNPIQVDELDELAAQYKAAVLNPTFGAPPVQSQWDHKVHEGESASAVRQLADIAGFGFDKQAAHGAAPDHLGSILLL